MFLTYFHQRIGLRFLALCTIWHVGVIKRLGLYWATEEHRIGPANTLTSPFDAVAEAVWAGPRGSCSWSSWCMHASMDGRKRRDVHSQRGPLLGTISQNRTLSPRAKPSLAHPSPRLPSQPAARRRRPPERPWRPV
jgi:hypothetical protein